MTRRGPRPILQDLHRDRRDLGADAIHLGVPLLLPTIGERSDAILAKLRDTRRYSPGLTGAIPKRATAATERLRSPRRDTSTGSPAAQGSSSSVRWESGSPLWDALASPAIPRT